MHPEQRRTCCCPLKISWITFAPWIQPTSQLQMGSFTGTVSDDGNHRTQTPILVSHIQYLLLYQVQICVPPPPKPCVPVTLCASTRWAPTPVCVNMATMTWARSWSLLCRRLQPAMVQWCLIQLFYTVCRITQVAFSGWRLIFFHLCMKCCCSHTFVKLRICLSYTFPQEYNTETTSLWTLQPYSNSENVSYSLCLELITMLLLLYLYPEYLWLVGTSFSQTMPSLKSIQYLFIEMY